jgi:DNA-binding CsgD family transcriptional regulator
MDIRCGVLLVEAPSEPPSHELFLLATLAQETGTALANVRLARKQRGEAAARLVPHARAGVALREDGRTETMPGLAGHALLAVGSPALESAHAAIAAGQIFTSFLWPLGGRHAPQGHLRITALARTEDLPRPLIGIVLVSPPGDVRGLTPRELEVLGLVIDGCSNAEIAHALFVAPRTTAAHIEHILAKLGAPTRTLAAVRAEREGLYVPPQQPGFSLHPR